MDQQEWLAEQFESNGPPARGGLPDARVAGRGRRCGAGGLAAPSRAGPSEVENLSGWLTTVVARVCAQHAAGPATHGASTRRRAHARPGRRCPDGPTDPEHEALLADSVGIAILVVLETLTPGRAARVRPARHVRGAVRADRDDRRAFPRGDPPARQPCPPPRARNRGAARTRPRPPAPGRRRVPGRPREGEFRGALACSTPTSSSGPMPATGPSRHVIGAETVAGQALMWSRVDLLHCGAR